MKKIINAIIVCVWMVQAAVYAQSPLNIPDTLTGAQINLKLQQGKTAFFPGDSTNTLGANGNILGPTIILDKGQNVDIKVENAIGETTTIHWHGMHVSPRNDGGPHTTIDPNTTWNPKFEVMDHAATYWYHPHLHEKTNEHVLRGIAGMLIVRDDEEASLDLPRTYGVDDFPVVLQTKAFDASNQIDITSALDSNLIINGTLNPYLDAPAQVVRMRLLNGSSERIYKLAFSDGRNFYQIASDGGLLRSPYKTRKLMIAPGERAEILVDFSADEGSTVTLRSLASELPSGYYGGGAMGNVIENYYDNPLNGNDFDIMDINVGSATANPVTSIPANLSNDQPLEPYIDDVPREITFGVASGGNGVTGPFGFVDRGLFDMNRIDDTVRMGDTEIWTLSNGTMIAHPFHIHDVQFYIFEKNGSQTIPQNLQGRKDVVLVEPMGTVRFIARFEHFADSTVPYMYHCHLLTHEDDGMMGQFLVLGKDTSANAVPEQRHSEPAIKVYPNPVGQAMNVELPAGTQVEKCHILSVSGRKIDVSYVLKSSRQMTVDLNHSGLNTGVYTLEILTKNGLYHSRFVKR